VSKHGWLWGGVLLVAVWVGVLLSLSSPEKIQKLARSRPESSKPVSGEDGGSIPEKTEPDSSAKEEEASIHPPDPALKAELEKLEKFLAARPNREPLLRFLGDFTAKFLTADPDKASATLLAYLRSGQDLPTGLDFVIGEGGLEEWPSLRAFLLDLLGKVDPEDAARYARAEVIPAKNSTVEYAVSLRILWNQGGAEKPTPELTQAWLGLLQKPDWSVRPGAAWMESLDFAGRLPAALPVFVGAATEWLGNPAVSEGKAESAQLALERSTRNHPVETLSTLLQNSAWLSQGRGPGIRASLFARVNLADSSQAEILNRYLLSLDPGSREATAFAKAFPYRKFSVSPGLSGFPDLQTPEEIRISNQAAAEFFRRAVAEGRYPGLRDEIAQIQARLLELNRIK